jgi:hypothetical protein
MLGSLIFSISSVRMTAVTDPLRFSRRLRAGAGSIILTASGFRCPLLAHDPRDGPVLRRRNANIG